MNRSLRVAVNGKSLALDQKGGALRVSVELVRQIALQRPHWAIRVFMPVSDEGAQAVPAFPDNVEVHQRRFPGSGNRWIRSLWEQIALPGLVDGWQADILLNLAGSAPVTRRVGAKQILLIHDAGFVNRAWFSAAFSTYASTVVRRAAERNAVFTTVSQSASDEILAAFPQVRQLTPIYNAVLDRPTGPIPPPDVEGDFILFLGALNPRKNLKGVIEAYRRIEAALPDAPKLLLVGPAKAIFKDPGLDGLDTANLVLPGYVDDARKWSFIAHARAVVLPSFLEAFGLPVLEALSVDTPVVASDLPCFRELYGDAVRYVDPGSPESIANGLLEVLTDASVKERLIDRGRDVATRYSWATSGEAYCRLIESTLTAGSAPG